MTTLETVIGGAGQAGLGVSHFPQREGRKHVVFERGRVGESWLSQRWDSFTLNTLNFMNGLPGLLYHGPEPDGFWRRDELVRYFRRYVESFQIPVRTGISVVSAERTEDEDGFIVNTSVDGQVAESVLGRSVVTASGSQQTPRIPSICSQIPDNIRQVHTADYRNAPALLPSAIVIVGSGQSGCQIAEDLLAAGRAVYLLCTSKVGRAPRRYRGRDILEWLIGMKLMDVRFASLEDKSISRAAAAHISGLERYGHTVSLQQLARQGVVILGRLLDVDAGTLALGDEAAAHVHFADEFSQRLKDGVDAYLKKAGMTPPPLEDYPADAPDPQADWVSPVRGLYFRISMAQQSQIGHHIWNRGRRPLHSRCDFETTVLGTYRQPTRLRCEYRGRVKQS
jgi:putative flavoprotein involved in K+ transport